MPLRKGKSRRTVSRNIADLISGRRGHRKRKPSQAVAIAYRQAGIPRKRKRR